jgi:hypothetical protein
MGLREVRERTRSVMGLRSEAVVVAAAADSASKPKLLKRTLSVVNNINKSFRQKMQRAQSFKNFDRLNFYAHRYIHVGDHLPIGGSCAGFAKGRFWKVATARVCISANDHVYLRVRGESRLTLQLILRNAPFLLVFANCSTFLPATLTRIILKADKAFS